MATPGAGAVALRLIGGEAGGWFARFAWLQQLVCSGAYAALSPAARAVLIVMYVHANADGEAWPGAETIGREAGLSERTARKARAELVRAGWLHQVRAGGGRNAGRFAIVNEIGAGGESLAPNREEAPGPSGAASGGDGGAPDCTPPLKQTTGHPCSGAQGTPEANDRGTGSIERDPENNDVDVVDVAQPTGTEPPGIAADQADLFEAADAVDELVRRTFQERDARKLVDLHGPRRVREVIADADYGLRMRRIQNLRGWIVSALRQGWARDPKAQKAAVRQAQQSQAQRQALAEERLWASLNAAEREQYRRRIIASFPAMYRRTESRRSVESFKRDIIRLAQAERGESTTKDTKNTKGV